MSLCRVLIAAWIGVATIARADERELTVFAAASLREAFEDLAHTLEARTPGLKVRLNLAGSQELRTQIEQGARVDVFAAADEKNMAALVKGGFVDAPRVFARNQLVVIVPAGNPAKLGAFSDLPAARKIVIGVPEVPIGSYTLEILDRAGDGFRARVLERVVSRELNVRQILAKVSLGEADAGVVYRTDAEAGRGKVEVIAIPPDVNATAAYPVAVLTRARQAAAARAFVELLLAPEGQKRLAAAGFTVAR
jgi:molybdate transport system substrate-binding protein